MLRGFRWQFIALLIAASLFVVGLFTRLSDQPPEPTPTASIPFNSPTPEPSLTPTEAPSAQSDPSVRPSVDNPIPVYREALVGRVQRLNPLLASLNPVDRDITSLVFEGLTRINEYGEAVPALAKEWLVSSDGLEWVVTLRGDILWQDGIPFNADDVVYTMAILRSPDFPGLPEVSAFWRTVETEKLTNSMIRFRLTQPLGSFPVHLTIGILPVHALEGTKAADLANHPFNLSPIGTGPYQLDALRSSDGREIDRVELRVAPVYRQRPEGQFGFVIDRISFHLYDSFDAALAALQSGEVDGLATRTMDDRLPLQNVASSGGYKLYNGLEPTLGALIYNWDEGDVRFFQDLRVRLALAAGLNWTIPVETHLTNRVIPADSPLLPDSWAYRDNLPWPAYDPAAAQTFLTAANIRLGGEVGEGTPTPEPTPDDGALYHFTILVPNREALVAIAEDLATQWRQLNLNVTVEAVDEASYQQRIQNGEFAAAIVELSIGADPDVYAFWHRGQYPDGLNFGGATDDEVSELLERARRDFSGVNRAELYAQFQIAFAERAVALPLYYPLFTYAVSANIQGLQLGFIGSPADRFRTIQHWHFAPNQ